MFLHLRVLLLTRISVDWVPELRDGCGRRHRGEFDRGTDEGKDLDLVSGVVVGWPMGRMKEATVVSA